MKPKANIICKKLQTNETMLISQNAEIFDLMMKNNEKVSIISDYLISKIKFEV